MIVSLGDPTTGKPCACGTKHEDDSVFWKVTAAITTLAGALAIYEFVKKRS